MRLLKPLIKYCIYQLGLAGKLDRFLFRFTQFQQKRANELYRKKNPSIILPSDYDIYETYRLRYQQFIEDGVLAASEIREWTKDYLPDPMPVILDWGCGAGRIIRHLPIVYPGAVLYGCDSNEERIQWNKSHIPGISFTTVNSFIPTPYSDSIFDLVYGISVLTHIDADQQGDWLNELARILKKDGILLISTQGDFYLPDLLPGEKRILAREGIFTKSYPRHGHRMMSTYHNQNHFKKLVNPLFTILEYYPGNANPHKLGGQDLWILKKKRPDDQ